MAPYRQSAGRKHALQVCAAALSAFALACATQAADEPTGMDPSVAEPDDTDEPTSTPPPSEYNPGLLPEPIDAGAPIDRYGYRVVGMNLYPPLYERVAAIACTNPNLAPGPCLEDEDCGPGFACVCGYLQGLNTLSSQCVPAECLSSADCGGGRCLLSMGSTAGDCCSFGNLGLFCSRSASTCQHGGDCPGNGQACTYDEALDGFACKPFGCACGN